MRHKDSIDRYLEHDLLLENRIIWVGSSVFETGEESGVNATMAERLVKNLTLLQLGPKAEDPITIQLSNFGGSWHHGMTIYDAIRACRAPIKIECFGTVMSMGSIILQAADSRVLHPNVRLMVHDGSDGYDGHARNFELWGQESARLRRSMYRIYAERSGKSVGYWSKKCIVDWVMSAEEAICEGLADTILQPAKNFNRDVVKAKKPRVR